MFVPFGVLVTVWVIVAKLSIPPLPFSIFQRVAASNRERFSHHMLVVVVQQEWGGVKGCTYVLTLGIAYFRPISKDVPKKRVRTMDLSSYRNYPGIIILIAPGKCIRSNALQLILSTK